MDKIRQAAQQALEAMEDAMYRADTHEFYEAKEALRAALAEPEQKPSGSFVLWQNTLCNPLADPIVMTHSAWHDGYASAKDELRALNAELVEALQSVVEVWFRPNGINYVDFKPYMEVARAALAKVEASK